MEDAKRREDRPSQGRTDSPPCSIQSGIGNQGPKGSTETKTSSLSLLRAMAGASKTSGQTPWLHAMMLKPSRFGLEDWFRLLSLWKERFIFLSLSLDYLLEYPYLIRIYIIELQILQLSLLQILQHPTAYPAGVPQWLQVVRNSYGGDCSGAPMGYMPLVKHEPSAMTKRPRLVRDSSQDQPGP